MTETEFHRVLEQGVTIGLQLGMAWGLGAYIMWHCARRAHQLLGSAWRERRARVRAERVVRKLSDWSSRPPRNRGDYTGFTLIELLIACSVICILATITYSGAVQVRTHCLNKMEEANHKFDKMMQGLPDF